MSKSVENRGQGGEIGIEGALSSAVSLLSEDALADLRRYAGLAGDASSTSGRMRFECTRVEGQLLPLLAGLREQALWQEIVASRACGLGSSLGVVLPKHLVLFVPESNEAPAEALVIPDTEICEVLRPVSGVGRLSAGELRVLKQVICGIDLAEAARLDGVTRETKRSQFKSVARKFSCHAQIEVANLALTQLLLLFREMPRRFSSSAGDLFRELVGQFLPEARTLEIVGLSGQRHRFVDVGPPGGRVVAMAHSQILPDIRPQDVSVLHEHGVRLVVPLRAGAMTGTGADFEPDRHIEHALEGIEVLRTHFSGEQIDLLGCVSGAAFALAYAQSRPERVRSLALVGCPAGVGVSGSIAGKFRQGLYGLAAGHWSLLSRVLDFYGRRINRPETFRALLMGHYRHSSSDLAVVEAEYAAPFFGERARKMFVSSIGSIKHDFLNQARMDWSGVPAGLFPILFLHGAQDGVHPIDHVRALARNLPGSQVHALPAAGQLLYHQHFEPMLSAYADFLQRHPADQIRGPV